MCAAALHTWTVNAQAHQRHIRQTCWGSCVEATGPHRVLGRQAKVQSEPLFGWMDGQMECMEKHMCVHGVLEDICACVHVCTD